VLDLLLQKDDRRIEPQNVAQGGESSVCSVSRDEGSSSSSRKFDKSLSDECLRILRGHTGQVTCLAVLNDHKLVSGGTDKRIKVWDLSTGECLLTMEGHVDSVRCLAKLSETRLASGSEDKSVKIWDMATGQLVQTLRKRHDHGVFNSKSAEHTGSVNCLAVFLEKNRLASGSKDESIKIWDLSSEKCTLTLKRNKNKNKNGHQDSISSLAVLDEKRLVSGSGGFDDGFIFIWNIENGDCMTKLEGHRGFWINGLEILNKRVLLSCANDKKIQMWNIHKEACFRVLEGHESKVTGLAILDDNRLMASCSEDKSVKIWDIAEGRCLRTWNE
jgi:WD40 repeat protein